MALSDVSDPFYKFYAVRFVDYTSDECNLCAWREELESRQGAQNAVFDPKGPWGYLYDLRGDEDCCPHEPSYLDGPKVRNEMDEIFETERHSYHDHCLRLHVLNNKRFDAEVEKEEKDSRVSGARANYSETHHCCIGCLQPNFGKRELNGLYDANDACEAEFQRSLDKGKARKRPKMRYQIWVHVIQGTDMRPADSNRPPDAIVLISAFGRTRKTSVGDKGKSFSAVWNEAFHFEKNLDIEEFRRETIRIKVEDRFRLWKNQTIGYSTFRAETVNSQPECEFYQHWTALTQISDKRKKAESVAIELHGKLQISICCISEENFKENPDLPIHTYDLEAQMWTDLDTHSEVVDFDHTMGGYLDAQVEFKRSEDEHLVSKLDTLLTIRLYKAEFLPKTSKGSSYVACKYEPLLKMKKELRTDGKPNHNPQWNYQFDIPVRTPLQDKRLELVIMDEKQILGSPVELGSLMFNLADVIEHMHANGENGNPGPRWFNFYKDQDGHPPKFHGRVLLDMTVQKKDEPLIRSIACHPLENFPNLGSYKLHLEVYEGIHLEGEHDTYQVDVAIGHSLVGDSKERHKHGVMWETVRSRGKRDLNHVNFVAQFDCNLHGLPQDKNAKSVNDISEETKSSIPDLIVCISKRKALSSACVGYLRIPVNCKTRRTENWEHGEDLTILPGLWDENSEACCMSLKPVKERHEQISGFLLLKATLKPTDNREVVKPIHSPVALVTRQRYKFIANVYQARDLSSVSATGLSNPYCLVQILDQKKQTQPKKSTLHPLWFQALEMDVELPKNLHHAAEINVGVFHHKDKSAFSWADRSVFMGKVQIPASEATVEKSYPKWYQLEFEEYKFGQVLMSFQLIPESQWGIVQHEDLSHEFEDWEQYICDVNALDIRGRVTSKFRSKKQKQNIEPVYELECWGDTQRIKQSEFDTKYKTRKLYIRKPRKHVFYSSINVRLWHGKHLEGSTSIPVQEIIGIQTQFVNLVHVMMRSSDFLAKKVIRKWKTFVINRRLAHISPAEYKRDEYKDHASFASQKDYAAAKELSRPLLHDDAGASQEQVARGTGLTDGGMKMGRVGDVAINVDDDHAIAQENYCRARETDEDGNEIVQDEQIVQIQKVQWHAEEIKEEEEFLRHWKIKCEYELLPFIKIPFQEYSLSVGQQEQHQGLVASFFTKSKRNVGLLRGNFNCYPEDEYKIESKKSNFLSELYHKPQQYTVRIYILRALQLSAIPSKCDPYIQGFISSKVDPKQTKIKDSTTNPEFYERFDFEYVKFPDDETTLTLQMYNDNSFFGADFIGETKISLENRLFSRMWQSDLKPVETRALFANKHSRIPQGQLEVCIDICRSGDHDLPLDYLLKPPVRKEWEMRTILYNAKNVTPKKIYHEAPDSECCVCKVCLPPNQSDIKLVCTLMGPQRTPQSTDVHHRSINGEGMFNWRCKQVIQLPAPKPLCYFKVQVWNVNWSPDDCIAECVVPLWPFFEHARRTNQRDPSQSLFEIPRQWMHMTHPHSEDGGDVELKIDLVPKEIADVPVYRASGGEEGWLIEKNAESNIIPKPQRPPSSFPWYRLDLQILYRVKYFCKVMKWWLLFAVVIAIGLVILFFYLN